MAAQELTFLDSLYDCDLSNIPNIHREKQRARITQLKNDWGLSTGVNITNSYTEEIDAGLSSRIFVKANLLGNGLYSNQVNMSIIQDQMKVDSLNGIQNAIDHNYGIYYNYIIYLFNQEKIKMIDQILSQAHHIHSFLKQLYYNKLVDYEEVLSVKNTIDQYQILRATQLNYNELSEEFFQGLELPSIPVNSSVKVDFEGIMIALSQDSTSYQAVEIMQDMVEKKYNETMVSSLSIAAGYDLSRKRPYYGVNFSTPLKFRQKEYLQVQKLELENDHRLKMLQTKKELLNLQYEFNYKEKQILAQKAKINISNEAERKLRITQDILELKESKERKLIALNRTVMNYEIVDLRLQQMLLLLKIKKIIHNIQLTPFIQYSKGTPENPKFAGIRFMPIDDYTILSKADQHFLEQNEIQRISPSEVLNIENALIIRAEDFEIRQEMEAYILESIENRKLKNIVIFDLESLKKLELNTINQSKFLITSTNM